jgi:hypothetical protein
MLIFWTFNNQPALGAPGAVRAMDHSSSRAISSPQRLHAGLCGLDGSGCLGCSGASRAIVSFPDGGALPGHIISPDGQELRCHEGRP